LVVEATLVEPSMYGIYPIQVLLSDKHTKRPTIVMFELHVHDLVEDEYGDESATEKQIE